MATEKRLIDVNKVICNMQKVLDEEKDNKNTVAYFAFEAIIAALKQEPTVDAVEVVRCKDCKYYMIIHCTCDGCCISDDWYCADGERRTDDAT